MVAFYPLSGMVDDHAFRKGSGLAKVYHVNGSQSTGIIDKQERTSNELR